MNDENKGLIKIGDFKSILEFLQAPAIKIAEAITGIITSDTSELKLSAGKLLQASIKHNFLSQLGKELKIYIKKGKIKEDYFASEKGRASLNELLKFIDEEVPDEERLRAIKAVFFASFSEDSSEIDKAIAYELIKICKKITGGGLLILKACYEITYGQVNFDYKGNIDLTTNNGRVWREIIAKQIGHNLPSLIAIYEQNLLDLKLITEYTGQNMRDRVIFAPTKRFRLTDLGYELCEFIDKYQPIIKESHVKKEL